MKTIIFILIMLTNCLHAQTKQDSIKLKSGARITKATYTDEDRVHYKTVYLSQSNRKLFVIAYNKKKKRFEKKPLPKNIEID